MIVCEVGSIRVMPSWQATILVTRRTTIIVHGGVECTLVRSSDQTQCEVDELTDPNQICRKHQSVQIVTSRSRQESYADEPESSHIAVVNQIVRDDDCKLSRLCAGCCVFRVRQSFLHHIDLPSEVVRRPAKVPHHNSQDARSSSEAARCGRISWLRPSFWGNFCWASSTF